MSAPNLYLWTDAGAPTLNNAVGSLLSLLRTCLVDGYGVRPITQIVVASEVATVTCIGHDFTGVTGQLVRIDGASAASLNGVHQPYFVNTHTFTYPAAGVPDGTYTGAMGARRAPLGWTEIHTGTNVAHFQRSDPASTQMLLRVSDTSSTTDARVRMLESAADIDNYVTCSPNFYWNKGDSDSTTKRWALVGAARGFFLFTESSSTSWSCMMYFLDMNSMVPGDEWSAAMCGSYTNVGGALAPKIYATHLYFAPVTVTWDSPASAAWPVVARNRIGASGYVELRSVGVCGQQYMGSTLLNWPLPTDAVPIMYPVPIVERDEPNKNPFRGWLPALGYPLAAAPFGQFHVVSDPSIGREFLAVNVREGTGVSQVLIDLTGPWNA